MLAQQVDLRGAPLEKRRWEVILLLNNCTDASRSLADRFRSDHPQFPLHVADRWFTGAQANIGYVRKLLMDEAQDRLTRVRKKYQLMLSTDADTEVASDWVAQNLAEAQRGAEAIGGRIKLFGRDYAQLDPQTRAVHIRDERYRLLASWFEDYCDPLAHDRWPRHHQHFGASFAVQPEVYRCVGGLPPADRLEDVAFYELLLRQDVKFRHSPDVCVYTSGRLEGRAAVGLSEQLRRWSTGPSTLAVPSFALLQALFTLRRKLRTLWQRVAEGEQPDGSALTPLAAALGVTIGELEFALQNQWFGTALASLNVPLRLGNVGNSQEPIDEAIHQLQRQFQESLPSANLLAEGVQSGIAPL